MRSRHPNATVFFPFFFLFSAGLCFLFWFFSFVLLYGKPFNESYHSLKKMNTKPCIPKKFFVKHEFDGIPHLVDVKQQKCTCRVWELLKFPYAFATLHCNGSNVFDYCECYAVTKYQEAYSRIILSIDLQERTKDR